LTVKGRFLAYLGTKQDEGMEDVRDECIICMGSSDDTKGVLLECGHFFCVSCFRELRRTMQGRRCPSCRTEITDRGITKIRLSAKEDESKIEEIPMADIDADVDASGLGGMSKEAIERERRRRDLEKIRLLDISRRREIAQFDMLGEYGSKINFLIKHLLWYRSREPRARHVIFSNWVDSLKIVIQALEVNRIRFSSFEDSKKHHKEVVENFVKDTSITVFLLHAERESSGLTLTSCSVVHLLEPVLRHSFELQAIGRVDRLGQDKETTVFCYATMPDTVESRILAQGVRNHTSIYLKDEHADTAVAEMPNVVSAAHKGGDLSVQGDEHELLSLIM